MPTKAEIVNQIEEQIIPNLMELITGGILQNVLLGMVDQINTLVGELDDLNTDDRSSIVNAINELVNNIQAIEDNLTPYVYFGIDDPNIVTPVGFGGDIPSFYVQQQHSGLDVVNIGFWTYTGIFGKEWVDLSLEGGGGGTPTLSEVLAEGNIADRDVEIREGGLIKFFGYHTDPDFEIGWDSNEEINLLRSAFPLYFTDINSQPYASFFPTGRYVGLNYLEINGSNADDEYSIKINLNYGSQTKGIIGEIEFDKQGDRKAFAQIADIEDIDRTIRLVLTPDGEDATTGDKMSFFADGDYEIISVNATAKTAPTGSDITIGLKVNGVDVTDVPITIPNGSKTSFSSTPSEFTATIELGDEITPNITAVGSTIKGKDVQLIFTYKKII